LRKRDLRISGRFEFASTDFEKILYRGTWGSYDMILQKLVNFEIYEKSKIYEDLLKIYEKFKKEEI